MTTASRAGQEVPGWRDLRHGGLLLDGQRLADLAPHTPDPLDGWTEHLLRRRATDLRRHATDGAPAFAKFVLEEVCGFDAGTGAWTRGAKVSPEWSRRAPTGEVVKPRQLWEGLGGGRLPVFMEPGPRVGIGKGRRTVSRVLGWLRAGNDHLALITNGKQWRLLFAGLDFEAWCEWDMDLWFQDGKPAPQVDALRTLLQPKLWTPASKDAASPLLQAIRDTRKGQAELSETLGERVREAVEVLIQGHGEALKEQCSDVDPADIYRAACRVAMRLVVILFAEARDLLPRDNPVYHASYGLNGLMERLQSAAGGHALSRRFSAWPQVQALFTLVHDGSHLPQMPVKDYGGELFKPGSAESADGLSRALAVFETACLKHDVLPDDDVRRMLERMTLTRVRIRQGRGGTWVTVPVDFSDLSSDYIGILYEGLLDYELKTSPPGEPVIFLAAGHYPALPLSRLEAMDDKAIKALFSNLKKDVATDDDGPEESEGQAVAKGEANEAEGAAGPLGDPSEASPDGADPRFANRTRAEKWARRAAHVAGLVKKPRGKLTPECRLKAEDDLARKARKLVARVVLPGEWYLVRWGGTRKGSGSFYTRPGLVVPTVQRTLRPLAYDPPLGKDGEPDRDAPAAKWTPKRPEQILELKVCDPACGSGAFVLSALRFLTNALFASLQRHGRIEPDGERTLIRLLGAPTEHEPHTERLGDEMIPCPQDHDDFEPRLRAVLRRHVVERCIYAVDIDPLAVELCRLSLWIETMDRGLPFGFLDHKVKCGNSLVGAWLDQFAHYPVMAWKNREGGDKNHGNGIHFKKGARTKAIKAFVKDRLTPDLASFLRDPDLFLDDHLKRHDNAHRSALAVLEKMHALPVQDATERARLYRDEFVGSSEWLALKEAMDLWCACWFWPADDIACAPLPLSFADPPQETREIARRLSAKIRFFHWELEFPDVFWEEGSGFNAVLGNPPWDTRQPNSKEYFSNIDPIYSSYPKQEALRRQREFFCCYVTEQQWLDYTASFANESHYMKCVSDPFGDFAKIVKKSSIRYNSHACTPHPYVHRGTGKAYTYKLFLEYAHALCRTSGRIGLIVPSGVYSDKGTSALRDLFLSCCQWEWLFGLENRDRIFPISSNYKFNPVIIEKGGSTRAIRTAFMRRKLDDWEEAERIVTQYSYQQIEKFNPKSQALLEIQSKRDLDILETMSASGCPLGDGGGVAPVRGPVESAWRFRYATEFNMTSDSKLFPLVHHWEAKRYRPDEYSRWLHGEWLPIHELWATMGIDHSHSPSPHRDRSLRCAQPPYDILPIPRAKVPPGIILSRTGDAWIHEDQVQGVALPLIEGKMMYVGTWAASGLQFDSTDHRIDITPKYMIDSRHIRNASGPKPTGRIAFRLISRSTNERTVVASVIPRWYPCANSLGVLNVDHRLGITDLLELSAYMSSIVLDWSVRQRMAGANLNWHIVESVSVPSPKSLSGELVAKFASHMLSGIQFAAEWLCLVHDVHRPQPFLGTLHERTRVSVIADVVTAAVMGYSENDVRHVLDGCDLPREAIDSRARKKVLSRKGFWRVDQSRHPECRRTVLTLVAFRDLQSRINSSANQDEGIRAWLNQNDGEGWRIPEVIRLADYGLGNDGRAERLQPVASSLGPRFYNWQIAQGTEEAWQECHLHARNLLGREEYARFLRDLVARCLQEGYTDISRLYNDYTLSLVRDPS